MKDSLLWAAVSLCAFAIIVLVAYSLIFYTV